MKIFKISLGIFFLAALAYWRLFSSVDGDSTQEQLFEISSGANFAEIGNSLEEQRIIRSDRAFTLMARLRGLDTKLKPGRYRLSQSMNLGAVLSALTNPEKSTVSVTIPEGFSVREIDERLAKTGLIKGGEFSSAALPFEGYLFPDTYFVFAVNFRPEDLVKKMQENFIEKITPELAESAGKNGHTLAETITMASIVEKEAKTENDLPIVAGILWKRIENGWPLQADAALLYGKSVPILTRRELSDDHSYNTYTRKGLPPTPIGNPGMKTIRAAIFPESSPYWFYLTDGEGTVHYAKTNEEQNENRRRYLK